MNLEERIVHAIFGQPESRTGIRLIVVPAAHIEGAVRLSCGNDSPSVAIWSESTQVRKAFRPE